MTVKMKRLPLLGLLGLTALLASCGGGSAYVPTTPASCSLPLQYTNTATSNGIAIPESTNWSQINTEVNRSISSCGLQRIDKLTVALCLQHTDITELRAQLVSSNNSTVSLALQSASQTSACPGLDNDTRSLLLTTTLQGSSLNNTNQANGLWLVQVRDFVPGYASGSFIGWSLQLDGVL